MSPGRTAGLALVMRRSGGSIPELDPTNPGHRGRVTAWLRHKAPTYEETTLLERFLRAPVRQPVAPGRNPAQERRLPPRTERQGLTSVDLVWLQGLPDDPAAVSRDDAAHLAHLEAHASSESEKRVVRQRLEPVRAYHDRQAERAPLEARLATPDPRFSRDRDAVVPLLAERIAEEVPELTEDEARTRAPSMAPGRPPTRPAPLSRPRRGPAYRS